MKYIVVLGDGMADRPIPELNGKTPLEVANKPNIDALCRVSDFGMVQTVPEGMKPGSDVANLSVMGYDPRDCYSGRSPLEALSIGVQMTDTDVAIRTNLVTLSSSDLSQAKMLDYSAGEISTAEAKELVEFVEANLGSDIFRFYAGVSYRHCLIWHGGSTSAQLTPPHDISGRAVADFLPKGENSAALLQMIQKSGELLSSHPVNLKRIAEGKSPATHIWFWGAGTKPCLADFFATYGIKGGVISAVDLLKGIAKGANMRSIDVDGATGNLDTNWRGKADAALSALKDLDYVYLHMEAPDEMGHHGEFDKKIQAIEYVDEVVGWLVDGLKNMGDYVMAILPDHATPVCCMTHTSEPVPYIIYRSNNLKNGAATYTEKACANGKFLSIGTEIIKEMLRG